ncbi:hypothetical protein [Nonomuraea sp. NPDC048916]|uniref:hypothetical protein n=1 Tax=Nonomuraea sp. NPDC048916 TaxID=3154232 RepID=UPI0033C74DFF
MKPIPFELQVTVTGNSPLELKEAAYREAERFFGASAETDVISARAEPDPSRPGAFQATIVFRQIATG